MQDYYYSTKLSESAPTGPLFNEAVSRYNSRILARHIAIVRFTVQAL